MNNCIGVAYGIPMDINFKKRMLKADVLIKDPGTLKIKLIKLLRILTKRPLSECKTISETQNYTLFNNVFINQAEEYKHQLEKVGVIVELVGTEFEEAPRKMTLASFLIETKQDISEKQTDCLILVVDTILKKRGATTMYNSFDEHAKKNFILNSLMIEEELWTYIVGRVLKYERLYAFT